MRWRWASRVIWQVLLILQIIFCPWYCLVRIGIVGVNTTTPTTCLRTRRKRAHTHTRTASVSNNSRSRHTVVFSVEAFFFGTATTVIALGVCYSSRGSPLPTSHKICLVVDTLYSHCLAGNQWIDFPCGSGRTWRWDSLLERRAGENDPIMRGIWELLWEPSAELAVSNLVLMKKGWMTLRAAPRVPIAFGSVNHFIHSYYFSINDILFCIWTSSNAGSNFRGQRWSVLIVSALWPDPQGLFCRASFCGTVSDSIVLFEPHHFLVYLNFCFDTFQSLRTCADVS
jgi:hypothetical protein